MNKKQTDEQQEIIRLKTALESFVRRTRVYNIGCDGKDELSYAVIGDTHIGSLYDRMDALLEFYKLLKKENIKTVFHVGDILDGHNVYKGQEFDQHVIGFEKQLERLKKYYPKVEGITTYFITGNHDDSFRKECGIDVGKEIERVRPDLHYLDHEIATIVLSTKSGKKQIVQLIHPGGGTAYAVSYKSQKIVESYSGGEKPDAVFIGHYHKADYMPCFRNVKAFQAGCFCSQTPFMMKMATPAHVGGWIIRNNMGGKLTSRVNAEFIAFYEISKRMEIK